MDEEPSGAGGLTCNQTHCSQVKHTSGLNLYLCPHTHPSYGVNDNIQTSSSDSESDLGLCFSHWSFNPCEGPHEDQHHNQRDFSLAAGRPVTGSVSHPAVRHTDKLPQRNKDMQEAVSTLPYGRMEVRWSNDPLTSNQWILVLKGRLVFRFKLVLIDPG